jgi:hypothetical protein
MMTLYQAVDELRRAKDDLRFAGLDACDQNVNWWLALPAVERRWWRGEEVELGDFGGYPDGPSQTC